MNSVQKIIYGILIISIGTLIVWIGFIYISDCNLSFICQRGQTTSEHIPDSTLAATLLPTPVYSATSPIVKQCRVAAVNLIGAWVSAGYSETEPFIFIDADGRFCRATFTTDVQPLFLESDLWYPGSPACASCHKPNVVTASAKMDLSTYQGMLMGSRRVGRAKGNDIFGGGDWQASLLYDVLYVRKFMPLGRPPDLPAEGPLVFAGTAIRSGTPGPTLVP